MGEQDLINLANKITAMNRVEWEMFADEHDIPLLIEGVDSRTELIHIILGEVEAKRPNCSCKSLQPIEGSTPFKCTWCRRPYRTDVQKMLAEYYSSEATL